MCGRFNVRPQISPKNSGSNRIGVVPRFGIKSSGAPQKVVRRVKWSKDRFELGIVRGEDDVSRVEAEPLPPVRLEPIRVLRADQREHTARCSRPLEFKDYAGIRWNARA